MGDEIKVSGASQTEYNGTFTIASVSTNSFTYTFAGSATSPATGTIKVQNLFAPWRDNDKNIVYTNKWGQPILKIAKDTSESKEYATWKRYDPAGRTVMVANPSAVSGYSSALRDLVGYDASTGAATYLNDTGLVEVTSYYVAVASPNTTGEYYMLTVAPEAGLIGYVDSTYLQRGDVVASKVQQSARTYTDGPIDDDGVYFPEAMTSYTGGDGDVHRKASSRFSVCQRSREGHPAATHASTSVRRKRTQRLRRTGDGPNSPVRIIAYTVDLPMPKKLSVC